MQQVCRVSTLPVHPFCPMAGGTVLLTSSPSCYGLQLWVNPAKFHRAEVQGRTVQGRTQPPCCLLP